VRQRLFRSPELAGAALRDALTTATDRWLADLLPDRPDVALLALGGYGRREPAPGSDLDLVLVHRPGADVAELADRLWYPVWDSGVGLDHALRTVPQAVQVARGELKAALGLLDARWVAGAADLAAELRVAVHADWRARVGRWLPELGSSLAERARRHGEVAFLLEPQLKEGRGGLRDVQALRAAAAGWLVEAPAAAVRAAYDLLLDVRGELHRVRLADGAASPGGRRGGDRLVREDQPRVAAALGYGSADELLTAVYSAGRTIGYAVDVTWRRITAGAAAAAPGRTRWRARGAAATGPSGRRPLAHDVVAQPVAGPAGDEADLARGADPRDPLLALRVAAAAAGEGLPVSPPALERLAAAFPGLPDPWPEPARQALLTLLGAGAAAVPVIEALDQVGLWCRLIPEWRDVRCLPQHNPYHRYTVDRHLTETAAAAAGLVRQVSRPDLLLVVALLHDIGKGRDGDHCDTGAEIATRVARRLGYQPPDVATVGRCVRHHLLLPDTAVRRDLEDPATVAAVAGTIGAPETLRLLVALAEADGRATGPTAWSEWKAALIAGLVERIDRLPGRGAAEAAGPPVVPGLTAQARQAAEEAGLHLDVQPAVGGFTVTVAAPDRPGLLWRTAAVLALHRLSVQAADVGAAGAVAVTRLQAAPTFGSPPEWDLLRADVRRALAGYLPLEARLAERERAYRPAAGSAAGPRVDYPPGASDTATVVEVRAGDGVGLLARLARAIAAAGLDVRAARVSTLGVDAVDVFYVTDGAGRPLPPQRRRQLADALLAAARPPPTG
jgi:[protein-PII] uridylyltransferase